MSCVAPAFLAVTRVLDGPMALASMMSGWPTLMRRYARLVESTALLLTSRLRSCGPESPPTASAGPPLCTGAGAGCVWAEAQLHARQAATTQHNTFAANVYPTLTHILFPSRRTHSPRI